MPTLRMLLDNNFNTRATADNMFVHVNTVHYRIGKIEQLLDIDLSAMSTRVELYTAVKVWDTLEVNGLLEAM
jgi:DNA-binding PucR family transcriptional regulator